MCHGPASNSKNVGISDCKTKQANLGLVTLAAGDRGSPAGREERSAKAWAAGSRKAERPAGLPAAVALLHLRLLMLPGNPGGAPFERKRRANQEVRGEPLQRRGRRAHFPFLWAPGTLSRRDRGTAGGPPTRKSSPVSTRSSLLRSAGTNSCQPRQPARCGVPPDVGCR